MSGSHHVDIQSTAQKSLCDNSFFETIAKKKRNKEGSLSTCDEQFLMNCQEHNRSWIGSAQALASMRWLLCGEKRDVKSMAVPTKNAFKKKKKICNRTQINSQEITFLFLSKPFLYVKKTEK